MDQNLRDASFIASDSRSNFKSVIAKRSDLVKFASGRMVSPGSDTVYEAGLVVGQVTTVGPNQGKYKPYASGSTDGSQVPVGVLSESTLASSNGDGTKINVIVKGALLEGMLIGLDAGAKTALGSRSYVESGVGIIEI